MALLFSADLVASTTKPPSATQKQLWHTNYYYLIFDNCCRDTQLPASVSSKSGDALMSLDAVLEVINEDIGDLGVTPSTCYDNYNKEDEQDEPLGMILISLITRR